MKSFYWITFIVFLIGCAEEESISLTKLQPTVLQQDGSEQFQYWEVENKDFWREQRLGDVPAISEYKDSLAYELGDSVLEATIRQRKEKQSLPNDDEIPADLSNKELVKLGYVGEIREVNYLEAQVLNYQLDRFPLLGHPTEFHGFIAKNDSLNRIRIYFGASDQPWPPKPDVIISHLENALQNGWRLTHHLHNHYEPQSNNYLGIMAPSLADAHYYKAMKERFDLSKALITNGFTTVELDSATFSMFNSH
jgi:hypothetical protein